MRIGLAVCLGAALMMSAPVVFAQTSSLRVATVVTEQTQLRVELEAGSGRAAGISATRRADLLARQQELLDMLDGKKTARELTPQQQLFARETLALIEAAVEDDDEERMVCRHEKTLGSNMVERTCRTVAQMRIDQERARATMASGMRD